jgi:hypothetical protein
MTADDASFALELAEFIEDPDGHRRPDNHGKDMHLHGNNVVTRIDGDAAVVTSYSVMLQDTPDGIVVTSPGTPVGCWHGSTGGGGSRSGAAAASGRPSSGPMSTRRCWVIDERMNVH